MKELISAYTRDIKNLCDRLESENLALAMQEFKAAYDRGSRILVAGNGGSAACVNHFYSDLGKNAVKHSPKRVKIISLSNSAEAITAIGNDINVDSVFSEQLVNLMEPGDLVLLVSASGNSPNILKAAQVAKEKCGRVVAFTGFAGGALKGMADICVNVESESYEQIEDLHLMLTHMVVCYFKSLGL